MARSFSAAPGRTRTGPSVDLRRPTSGSNRQFSTLHCQPPCLAHLLPGGALHLTRAGLPPAAHEWCGRESIDDEIAALLPPRELTLTHDDLLFIDKAFAYGTIPGIKWMRPGQSE